MPDFLCFKIRRSSRLFGYQSPRSNHEKVYRRRGLGGRLRYPCSCRAVLAFDPASHKCSMMHTIPSGSMKNTGGPYKTKTEAKKAMHGMKECTA